MHELNKYSDVKESKMRGDQGAAPNEASRYVKDVFGGMHGVDPSSHGAELQ